MGCPFCSLLTMSPRMMGGRSPKALWEMVSTAQTPTRARNGLSSFTSRLSGLVCGRESGSSIWSMRTASVYVAVFIQDRLDYSLDVGFRKVIAFEQERLVKVFRQGIGEAISKVEFSGVTRTSAKV